jgi:hypothetical protein
LPLRFGVDTIAVTGPLSGHEEIVDMMQSLRCALRRTAR